MITIRLSKDGQRIGVFCPPQFAEYCKSVAGYTWNSAAKAWVYPANPPTAVHLNGVFRDQDIAIDPGFKDLIALGSSAYDSAINVMKQDVDSLRNPPIIKEGASIWTHQLRAFWYAVTLWGGLENPHGGGVMLPLKMGRGKTLLAIYLIVNMKFRKVLIITPSKVVQVWPEQFALHDPGRCHVLPLRNGTVQNRAGKAQKFLKEMGSRYPLEPSVIVTNYEAARSSHLAAFTLNTQWDCVILDESHRIKQHNGLTSKWAALVAKKAKFRLSLTGTPMPHSPMDLFSQYRFLDVSIFGPSWTKYRARYAEMGGYGNHQIVAYKNQEELSSKFYSIAYRIKPEEDMAARAEPITITRKASLGKGYSTYWDMHNYMVSQLKDGTIATAANALVKLLRLQQITGGHIKDEDGTVHEVDEAKGELLADILADLDEREPIVIFCNFHADIDMCRKICVASGRTVSELSGREDQMSAWKDGETDVLIAQIQSGKEGISLVRSKYNIYYSVGFSLSDYDQSVARTNRPGQQATEVTCIHLVLEGTVDEKVYAAIAERREIVEYVTDYMRGE